MKTLNALSDAELLQWTRNNLQSGHKLDAELLNLLGEIDARRLYADHAYSSMFVFCSHELGFSEDVACNRIEVARMARRFPRILDFVKDGSIHLTGLRLLAPHLTEENLETVLASAVRKTRKDIEHLVAALAPKPAVPTSIRKLPERASAVVEESPVEPPAVLAPTPAPVPRRPEVKPLSAETYKVEFTADRALKAKLEQAEELLRHRVGRGNLVAVIDHALDLLITEVKQERFGVGRKPRSTAAEAEQREVVTRHVPTAIRREVFENGDSQCEFVSDDGRRCEERGGLELEHTTGFARTRRHSVAELKLFCRTHNQHAADKLYGRDFMEAKRRALRPGTDHQASLL